MLIDGDGLTAIAENTGIITDRKAATILTPHMGEMSRLTGMDKAEIEKDRVSVLQTTAQMLNAYIVLKGPHSLTGCPDSRVFINNSGDTEGKSGMATAGSGDVLNGTIAAMFCLGLEILEAVRTGVFMHGLAGVVPEEPEQMILAVPGNARQVVEARAPAGGLADMIADGVDDASLEVRRLLPRRAGIPLLGQAAKEQRQRAPGPGPDEFRPLALPRTRRE